MPGNLNEIGEIKPVAGCRPPADAYDADIIILSYNRLTETLAAIRSALAQRGANFHVTVLDQGSSPEVLRSIARTFACEPNFALYASPKNLGVAGGRNLATSFGHGKIIVALDNDAVFGSKWVVTRALRAFHQRPDLGALGFNILSNDGTQLDRSSWGYPARLMTRFREKFDTTTFVGAGHAIRRLTWNLTGGYDPAFFFTWEEYDFCLTAISLNWRICYDGSLPIFHGVTSEARVTWSANRMTHFVRNRLLISRKWGASWISLTPRVTGYLIKATLNHSLGAAAKGVQEAIRADIPNRKKMPKAMRNYLFANETRHRGTWIDRLRLEVMGRMSIDP